MKITKWQKFFEEKTLEIFNTSKFVLDIGGGLRVDRSKNIEQIFMSSTLIMKK